MKSYLPIAFLFFLLAAGCTSGEQGQTTVAAHMEEAIKQGENLLFCSTFQLAWNELKYRVVGEHIRLTGDPLMAKFLNKRTAIKEDLSEDCHVAMAGFGNEGIVKKIRKALEDKFGDDAPEGPVGIADDKILAYAYLCKNLRFDEEFEGLKAPVVFHSKDRNTKVQAFGIEKYSYGKHKELGKQVEILEYKDDSEFIIRLKSVSPEDEIILAKVKPGDTLLATIEEVLARVEQGRAWPLSKGDTLQVPKFDFDIEHSYSELIDRFLENKGFEKQRLVMAMQCIRFKLDQKGAVLKSEARIRTDVPEASTRPRRFVFDRPFLLYLKEKGAKYPYFAMWVENTELMVKE